MKRPRLSSSQKQGQPQLTQTCPQMFRWRGQGHVGRVAVVEEQQCQLRQGDPLQDGQGHPQLQALQAPPLHQLLLQEMQQQHPHQKQQGVGF